MSVLTNMNIHVARNINVSSENIQMSYFSLEYFPHPMIVLTQFLSLSHMDTKYNIFEYTPVFFCLKLSLSYLYYLSQRIIILYK